MVCVCVHVRACMSVCVCEREICGLMVINLKIYYVILDAIGSYEFWGLIVFREFFVSDAYSSKLAVLALLVLVPFVR